MSKLKVLVLSTSPRKDGNSDLLACEAVRGAEEAGASVEYIRTATLQITPCRGCGFCEKKGECVIRDDFPAIMDKMLGADLLVFATPIYFMGVGAWGKMAIDRCQALWSRKYVLEQAVRDDDKKYGALCIAVGGSRSMKMFECVRLTMKYFYDVLEITETDEVFYNQIDEKGAVKERPEALEEAFRKAAEMSRKLAGST